MALVLLPTCLCQQQQQEKGERGGCLITTDRGRWTIAGKEEGTRVWHYVQQLVATQRQERIRCTHSAPPTNRFLFSWAARLDSPHLVAVHERQFAVRRRGEKLGKKRRRERSSSTIYKALCYLSLGALTLRHIFDVGVPSCRPNKWLRRRSYMQH